MIYFLISKWLSLFRIIVPAISVVWSQEIFAARIIETLINNIGNIFLITYLIYSSVPLNMIIFVNSNPVDIPKIIGMQEIYGIPVQLRPARHTDKYKIIRIET